DRVLPRVQEILSRYFQSRLLVASAKGLTFLLLLAAGRLFLDLPGVYTLALLGGVLSLIPVIGPLIAFLALAGVCFVTEGLTGLLFAGGVYAIGETLEGYVFLPRLVGKGIGMGDLAILLAVFCGGTLFGMFGILIAVPAVAVSKVLYHEFLRPVMGVDTTTAG
ncbi:MAG TPA: AI-2E family transporter, partial [Planctomycetota bacterium]